jgi:hypothetical protein
MEYETPIPYSFRRLFETGGNAQRE